MRFHPRRVLTSALVGTCILIVILNIHLNTQSVTDEELQSFIRAHKGHGGLDNAAWFDPGHPLVQVNLGTARFNKSVNYMQRFIHVPDWARQDFLHLVASTDRWDDRILRQMSYVPLTYQRNKYASNDLGVLGGKDGLKVIYAVSGLGDVSPGRGVFVKEECPVDACFLTDSDTHEAASHAHVLQSEGFAGKLLNKKPAGQIWILWALESPLNTAPYYDLSGKINWTATYRSDSTIVTPYEKFIPYKDNRPTVGRNYATGKSGIVAWFVSNCGARNSRMEYAKELAKHVQVDIYGACGERECPRTDADRCNTLLSKQYKFYLSFENSNCEYYITEKFFWNGLKNDVVPIVMGGRKEDYARMAPPHSYIHVEDFRSAEELATYLVKLHTNDVLYNEYFRWKSTGYFLNTKFWCRLCAMLHDDTRTAVWYGNLEAWWRKPGTCSLDRWDNPKQRITDWEKAWEMD